MNETRKRHYFAVHDKTVGRHVVVSGDDTDELLAYMERHGIRGDLLDSRPATEREIEIHEETKRQLSDLPN